MNDIFKNCKSVLIFPDISKWEINGNAIINNETSSLSSFIIKAKTPPNTPESVSEAIKKVTPTKKTEKKSENNLSPEEDIIMDKISEIYNKINNFIYRFKKYKWKLWLEKYPIINKIYMKFIKPNNFYTKIRKLYDSFLDTPTPNEKVVLYSIGSDKGNCEEIQEFELQRYIDFDDYNNKSKDFYGT